MYKIVSIIVILFALGVDLSNAQTGSLRGGSTILSNGTNTITLKPPSSGLTSYTWSLDTNQNSPDSTRWLKNDGSGNLSWDAKPGGLTGNGVQYTPGAPQNTATSGNYLFYIQNLSTNSNVNSPGGFIASSVVDGPGSSAVGLTVTVQNTLASATSMILNGICSNASSGPAGGDASIVSGVTVNATGSGTNYAGLFNGGNAGFGTLTPTSQLEVNGNIRISGQNKLKITEGTNATMGLAQLVVGGGISSVVVNTTKVTDNSRIFLMSQDGAPATIGTAYITARTANSSFTIQSTSNTDVSNVAWWIVEPDITFTANGTFVVPSGVTTIYIDGVGGAGGGGGGGGDNLAGNNSGAGGGGGGAGEYIPSSGFTVVPGETLTITVGTGGAGGAFGTSVGGLSTDGGNGSVTTISGSTSGVIFTANGGTKGLRGHNTTADAVNQAAGTGGAGGTGSTTTGHTNGNAGATGTAGANTNTNKAGGAGGIGPTGGNLNTGGTGGTGNGGGANGTAGTAGTSGYVHIIY
jgi:hypothetical protein